MTTVLAVAVFVIVYALIATERVPRTVAALGGVAAVFGLGIVGAQEAFYSRQTGIDWNVIFLLLGMMLVVAGLRRTGLFEFLAIWSAKRTRGRPYPLLVLLCTLTAVASALLDNVTTVLLVAPVTLLVCNRLKLNPVPFLIAEVLASNIGGASTLVGDPPNIIIGSRADLSFVDFVVNLGPIVVIVMVAFLLLSRFVFRDAFTYDPEAAESVMHLDEREAIENPRALIRGMAVLVLVLIGFVLQRTLGIEPSIVALLGGGAMMLAVPGPTDEYMKQVEWETLVFFMGLFVLVGALVEVGAIDALASALTDAVGGDPVAATFGILFGSAALSAIVDNIPYVATMAPVVDQLATNDPALNPGNVLWWSLALGADFGGNATAIGASANVVVIGIAKRYGYPISFWQFTRYGLLVTVVSIALCVPYLWLRYLA
ncbi:MAG: ArsB/NhaD family transporter [Actinomycetia bacterium]|nr:ArsB/NhaD family transporter [Actinomycetes bacterium]